jgi:hypothetical protein
MQKSQILFALLFLLGACSGEKTDISPQLEAESVQGEFFANLFEQCGETFSGEATFPENPDDEMVGVTLVATVQTCTEEEVRISLAAGEDESRTWIISRTENGLHLRHDHRYPDGTPYDLTNYGGHATDDGTASRQYFAADSATKQMLPEAETNVWMMEIEGDDFTYYLERHSEPRFRAELARD